jgi:DnaJ-domain-containing protein 1
MLSRDYVETLEQTFIALDLAYEDIEGQASTAHRFSAVSRLSSVLDSLREAIDNLVVAQYHLEVAEREDHETETPRDTAEEE